MKTRIIVAASILTTLAIACGGGGEDDNAAGESGAGNEANTAAAAAGEYTLDDKSRGGTLTVESAGVNDITFSLGVVNNFGGNNMGDLESVKATRSPAGFTYKSAEDDCNLVLKVAGTAITVKQTGTCGFGANVIADGTYKKTSGGVGVGCASNEDTIFKCSSRNGKIIAVCAQDLGLDGGYLQYRFGTKDKVELSLPANDKRADFKKSSRPGTSCSPAAAAITSRSRPAGTRPTSSTPRSGTASTKRESPSSRRARSSPPSSARTSRR